MTWSGFRPSDDPSQHGFPIPANMYAWSGLARALELNRQVSRLDMQALLAQCIWYLQALCPFQSLVAAFDLCLILSRMSAPVFGFLSALVLRLQVWQMPEFESKARQLMADIRSGEKPVSGACSASMCLELLHGVDALVVML
jgi:hypothetical protein